MFVLEINKNPKLCVHNKKINSEGFIKIYCKYKDGMLHYKKQK